MVIEITRQKFYALRVKSFSERRLIEMLCRFRKKNLSAKIPSGTIEEIGGNFKIKTACAEAEINFYDLGKIVVEMSITNLADGENKFYLHFELRDLSEAEKLFAEMIQELAALERRRTMKILLTCTGGLTTSFFADKLNAAAKVLSLDLEFSAVGVARLEEVAADFEMILLAPQVAYKFDEVKKILPNKKIYKIPTKIFASYGSSAMINFIRENSVQKNIFIRKLIAMKNFLEKLFKLAEIAKKSWIEGSRAWSYENYKKILG